MGGNGRYDGTVSVLVRCAQVVIRLNLKADEAVRAKQQAEMESSKQATTRQGGAWCGLVCGCADMGVSGGKQ